MCCFYWSGCCLFGLSAVAFGCWLVGGLCCDCVWLLFVVC